MTDDGTTVTVCGMSRNGSVNLGEDNPGARPPTVTNSEVRTSTVTAPGAVNTNPRLVPASNRSSACSAVNWPDTPADRRSRSASVANTTLTPVTASKAAMTDPIVPGGMLNGTT